MPLVRYELRNELGLANPQLYRTAGKDDSEALLAGVAMAGLVGIIRQLGDLAEFAAEIFNELHTETMTMMGCCHELKTRVLKLEVALPVVEKSLLSEASQLRFIYSPGAEWHASLPSDENHFTRGDLPRFLHNLYDDCRGPPRLFLLDKFDAAGAGACVKRYTDPSIFMKIWADSELKKAEQEQQKARRERKEAKLRKKRLAIAGFHPKPRERYSVIHLGNLEGFSGSFIPSMKASVPVRQGLDQILEIQENGDQTPLQLTTDSRSAEGAQTPSLAPLGIDSTDAAEAENLEENVGANVNKSQEEDGEQIPPLQSPTSSKSPEEEEEEAQTPQVESREDSFARSNTSPEDFDQMRLHRPATGSRSVEGVSQAQPSAAPLAIGSFFMDMAAHIPEDNFERLRQVKVAGDTKSQEEGASDSDYFVDALTTLESESESDTESRTWPEPDTYLPKTVVVSEEEASRTWPEPDTYLPKTGVESEEEVLLLNHSALKAHVESQRRVLPRGIDLLEEQPVVGLSPLGMTFRPDNDDLDVDDSSNCRPSVAGLSPTGMTFRPDNDDLDVYDSSDLRPSVESTKPPMPHRDFGAVGSDHCRHAQSPPKVAAKNAERDDTHRLSELETKSQSEADLFFTTNASSLGRDEGRRSGVASETVGDKRESDNCGRTLVSDSETRAWATTPEAHRSAESDQALLENNPSAAWQKAADSPGHTAAFPADDLHTLPHSSIEAREESVSDLPSLQHKQPPAATQTCGADEGDGLGMIAKKFINNEEEQGAGGLGELESESPGRPALDEATVPGEGSLLDHSALEQQQHVNKSRRQRRRWDIDRVWEQAQIHQLAVELEDDVVIESPEPIPSAVDSLEPQLPLEYQGRVSSGNGHAQPTSNTMELESVGRPDFPDVPDVVEAPVPPAEDHHPIRSHTAAPPKKPAKSQRQRPSKSMHLEKAVCHTRLKSEDSRTKSSIKQPHSVVMLTKPPIFLEYLGSTTRRENGDDTAATECDILSAAGPKKLDDRGGARESSGFSRTQQGLDFTESDKVSPSPPLTHLALKKHAESRRQRPRWDIDNVKKRLVLTKIRPESDSVTASSSVLNSEEPDSLVELSEPPPTSSNRIRLPNSPVLNRDAQAISHERILDDPEADRDSPELSEPPPLLPEELLGVANSPAVNGHHAHAVSKHIPDTQECDSVEVSEAPVPSEDGKIEKPQTVPNGHAQVVSSEQIADGGRLDFGSLDGKELILRSDPCGVADHNNAAGGVYRCDDTLPHQNQHVVVEQEPHGRTTILPSLSSSPYTPLSSLSHSDENPYRFDCTSSASSPQWSTPSNALHSPPESPPARSSCAKLPTRPLPLVRLLQSSPRASSSPDSNQISDAEIDEALMDAVGNCMATAAMDILNTLGNQNLSMELIRKQYQRRRHSGLQKKQGSWPVTGNGVTVAAIMEKANAIRQEIVNSDEDEEENDDLKNEHI